MSHLSAYTDRSRVDVLSASLETVVIKSLCDWLVCWSVLYDWFSIALLVVSRHELFEAVVWVNWELRSTIRESWGYEAPTPLVRIGSPVLRFAEDLLSG